MDVPPSTPMGIAEQAWLAGRPSLAGLPA
jgi:hypothetical protein